MRNQGTVGLHIDDDNGQTQNITEHACVRCLREFAHISVRGCVRACVRAFSHRPSTVV